MSYYFLNDIAFFADVAKTIEKHPSPQQCLVVLAEKLLKLIFGTVFGQNLAHISVVLIFYTRALQAGTQFHIQWWENGKQKGF